MPRFDPHKLVGPGQIAWDPEHPGLGYRRSKTNPKGGAWVVRFNVSLPDGTTIRPIETLDNAPNREQAVQLWHKRRGEAFTGTYTVRARATTVSDFAKKFLRLKEDLATVDRYEQQLEDYLLPWFGDMPLRAVKTGHCQEYFNARKKGVPEREWAPAAPATARKELRCLQSLFVEAEKVGLVEHDPVKHVDFGEIANERERTVDRAELARLVVASNKLRVRYMTTLVHVLYYTAARISHACRLRWEEFGGDFETLTTLPDKGADEVTIPVHPALRAELRRWRLLCPSRKWVFPAHRDKTTHMSRHGMKTAWARMLKLAGITERVWRHDMRRTAISELKALGASDKQVMRITGQKTESMIRRYEQPTDTVLKTLVDQRDPPAIHLVRDF
jgi:integrase